MAKADWKKEAEIFAANIRIQTLRQLKGRGFGHAGGALSIADTLAVLYGKVMNIRPSEPKWEGRDWFILSKGHAGPALYAALSLKGYFNMNHLDTLNRPGTILPSHPDRNKTPGVDLSTGSLGQGVSQAMGVALGFKLQGKQNRVYAAAGDGECNEGQVWEAILFASHRKLDNLILFVDYNGKQLDGCTKDICDLGDLPGKFRAFGWNTQEIDGHDVGQIYDAIEKAKKVSGCPSAIILNTVKGKGVKFIEDMPLNHHINITAQQADEAMAELEKGLAALKCGQVG